MVPEVSLIMEKPRLSKKIDDALSNAMPELRSSILRIPKYSSNESYASWKEKQFAQQPMKQSPIRPHEVYSSTQNISNLQNGHGLNQTLKSSKSFDYRDYSFKNKSSDYESPRPYNASRSTSIDNSNKYVLSHAVSDNEIEHHVYQPYNYKARSYNKDERIHHERRYVDYSHDAEGYEFRPKPRIYRSSSCSNADSYIHRSIPIEHEYEPRHSRSLQPVHCSPEHSHCYSGCCLPNHNNSNTETETVKNLLQVITSQNEQIKNLQKQVERLLKLHEQSLKERNHCSCQSNGMLHQNKQLHEQQIKNVNLPIASSNVTKDNERCYPDIKLQDEKTKSTILEQKVSIGVMTSFELKVQNNPSLNMDNDIKQRSNQEKVLPSSGTSNIIKNLVNDTGEMIRKKNNFFNPNALENISEASESHMSSLRQSHLCSDTTRQSVEAEDTLEVQNTNFHKHNYQGNIDRQIDLESKNYMNESNEKKTKLIQNSDHEAKKVIYDETNNDIQERPSYEYNFHYENIPSLPQDVQEKRCDEINAEPLMTDITKLKSTKCDNFADECLSLSSSELDMDDLSPPSPEPSIHLDIQEYSSEGGSLPPQRAKVGWTLYNNVLDQVNQILQNTPVNMDDDDLEQEPPDDIRSNERKEYDNNIIMDTVKAATLEQLTKLGISFSENLDQREPNYNKKVVFDASYYARKGPETHLASGASIETNTSMHMKELAKKYLNDEQLADIAIQKSRVSALKQIPNNVQNTNMSFATMHYLQRYQLLPGTNASPKREAIREDYKSPGPVINERLAMKTVERREQSPHKYAPFTGASKVNYPSKILDISTLKQQPKLL